MKILIAGDFCPCNRVMTDFEHGAFDKVLGGVKTVIESADYSIVNFECPVIKGGEKPISKVGPNLSCSEKGMEAVEYAGFDCVTLANNHFYDYGDEGVANTMVVCNKYSIDYVGGGKNLEEASRILYKQINGRTLAIINCCEHEFSIASDTTAGSNPLNPIQQYYAIKEACSKADYVIVIVHGGHEHFQLPSPRMVETYRFFIDAGADAVVNHHQHCFSGYEEYKGKPIFYGLGNFCFDSPKRHNGIWTEGFMVLFSMDNRLDYSIIPYRQCADTASIKILPVDTFDSKLKELNAIIIDNNKLLEETERYYTNNAKNYGDVLEPIRNRFYLGCKRRGWLPSFVSKRRILQANDYICCEAHRDKLIWWLKQVQKKSI